jgi:hypothetical protein
MAAPTSRTLSRPAHDEWGVYDPEQAGLEALYARLDARQDAPAPAAVPQAKVESLPPLPARKTLRDAQ